METQSDRQLGLASFTPGCGLRLRDRVPRPRPAPATTSHFCNPNCRPVPMSQLAAFFSLVNQRCSMADPRPKAFRQPQPMRTHLLMST
jgi:hypothetical protein